MIEKHWSAVPPVAFTATGTARGRITVTSTAGFRVKMEVILTLPNQPDLALIVNRVLSPTQMELGLPGASIGSRYDLSAYDITAFAYAREQKRPSIPLQEIERAIYEEEPVVALRVIDVDQFGAPYSLANPLPVQLSDGAISIQTLNAELNVALSARDNFPKAGDIHSSVRIGDGTNELKVNPDGSLNFNLVQSGAPGLQVTYNAVTAVASGSETSLISMVIPPAGFRLMKIAVSGENLALFSLKINSTTIMTKRSWWNNWNQEFSFEDFQNGLTLSSGQILSVTVQHNRPVPANYEITVMGI